MLLSLLAPNGVMRVGLYSEAARRSIVEARALVARRGYPATAEGIRALRQSIISEREDPRWKLVIGTVDFYSMSGCRDMFFNVMEHRLTLPEIATFLKEQNLSFLGFELDPETTQEVWRTASRRTGASRPRRLAQLRSGQSHDIPQHVRVFDPQKRAIDRGDQPRARLWAQDLTASPRGRADPSAPGRGCAPDWGS